MTGALFSDISWWGGWWKTAVHFFFRCLAEWPPRNSTVFCIKCCTLFLYSLLHFLLLLLNICFVWCSNKFSWQWQPLIHALTPHPPQRNGVPWAALGVSPVIEEPTVPVKWECWESSNSFSVCNSSLSPCHWVSMHICPGCKSTPQRLNGGTGLTYSNFASSFNCQIFVPPGLIQRLLTL